LKNKKKRSIQKKKRGPCRKAGIKGTITRLERSHKEIHHWVPCRILVENIKGGGKEVLFGQTL